MKPRIVILDGGLANPGDLSWAEIEDLGELKIYDQTPEDLVLERSEEAQILIVNKIVLNKTHFSQLPQLKLICLLATGYDNIAVDEAKQHQIVVCNAVGYAVPSVAQHVFAMILSVFNRIKEHNRSIQNGAWSDRQWSYSLYPLSSLNGKTIGIYGFGKIGQKVAAIARGFDMKIIAHHKHPERDAMEGVDFVSIEELFERADIITLHAPLTKHNAGIVNGELLSKMKRDALLVNTGRGGLIVERDLKKHLLNHSKSYALLDVLSEEPPRADHPLIGLENCILTPHNAWASLESRRQLLNIVAKNIASFLDGNPVNVIE